MSDFQASNRRLLACLDHCAGVSTEAIEAIPYGLKDMLEDAVAYRELLGAAEAILQVKMFDAEAWNDATADLRAACVRTRGEAPPA